MNQIGVFVEHLRNIFQASKKKLRGEASDVFTYDEISRTLRVQICHIWLQCLGQEGISNSIGNLWPVNPIYLALNREIAAEFGLFSLANGQERNQEALVNFFVKMATPDQALDMIEITFRYAERAHQDWHWKGSWNPEIPIEEAVGDLNIRFLKHGVGYAFVGGELPQLIRKDNQHLHVEVIIPALQLLHEQGFSGANAEYRSAHSHYRNGAHKECLNDCLKAFESTMKTICKNKRWSYKETDTASALIDICLKNGILPPFMQTHLGTVRSALESAIPTLRNKLSGHGQGAEPKDVPQYYAEYLLHETAATIVFLVDAYKAIK